MKTLLATALDYAGLHRLGGRHRNFHRYETIRRAWQRGGETKRGQIFGPPIVTQGEKPRPVKISKQELRRQAEDAVREFLERGGTVTRR